MNRKEYLDTRRDSLLKVVEQIDQSTYAIAIDTFKVMDEIIEIAPSDSSLNRYEWVLVNMEHMVVLHYQKEENKNEENHS